jgi:hypothetical protein
VEDFIDIICAALSCPSVDGIEINIACPNVPGSPTLGYSFGDVERLLSRIAAIPGIALKPVGIKLPPYLDAVHCRHITTILCGHAMVKYVVTCNSIGHTLLVDQEKECCCINANRGFGGLGGGFIKPVALANVRSIHNALVAASRTDIHIVGVGGICSGSDVFEMILCGATAVQVGTCFWNEGPNCFKRISNELTEIMRLKGYRTIEDFRGQLKQYTEVAKLAEGSVDYPPLSVPATWETAVRHPSLIIHHPNSGQVVEGLLLFFTSILNAYLGLLFVYALGSMSVLFVLGLMVLSAAMPFILRDLVVAR